MLCVAGVVCVCVCVCARACVCVRVCVSMYPPLPVRHGTASCGLLVLPQEDLPALTQRTGAHC